jgi:tRNA pseudouridine38-40 synthase
MLFRLQNYCWRNLPNIRLIIEYEGSRFHGWQVQPGLRTIQGELQRVLEMVLRKKVGVVRASGRTDAGVHAKGQVVNFHFPEVPDLYLLTHSVSSILRGELAVLSAEIVADDFDAQKNAVSKQYIYTILNRIAPPTYDWGRVWHIGRKLDVQKMIKEAEVLVGEYDFGSFRGKDCSAKSAVRRIIESEISSENDFIYYRVVGTGFLKQMVRIITGTLVALGRGFPKLEPMREILMARDRSRAGETAPPQGLCLDWVKY